jgi:hypothetical protein
MDVLAALIAAGGRVEGAKIVGVKSKFESVNPAELLATQDYLNPDQVRELADAGGESEPVQAVRHKGRLYLWDGHHRAAAAALRGEMVEADVIAV